MRCMGLAGLGAYAESQLVGWMELCLRIKANMVYRKSFDKAVEWSQDEHPCWKKIWLDGEFRNSKYASLQEPLDIRFSLVDDAESCSTLPELLIEITLDLL